MQRIEKSLPPALRGKVDFLLVSMDRERDSPAVLQTYREKRHFTPGLWTLLHGASDDVRELAALLGVNYQRDARGQFAHSNVITVLNAEGEIAHQQVGLASDISETVAAIEKLPSAKASPAR
jgi:protein SCO1/2